MKKLWQIVEVWSAINTAGIFQLWACFLFCKAEAHVSLYSTYLQDDSGIQSHKIPDKVLSHCMPLQLDEQRRFQSNLWTLWVLGSDGHLLNDWCGVSRINHNVNPC